MEDDRDEHGRIDELEIIHQILHDGADDDLWLYGHVPWSDSSTLPALGMSERLRSEQQPPKAVRAWHGTKKCFLPVATWDSAATEVYQGGILLGNTCWNGCFGWWESMQMSFEDLTSRAPNTYLRHARPPTATQSDDGSTTTGAFDGSTLSRAQDACCRWWETVQMSCAQLTTRAPGVYLRHAHAPILDATGGAVETACFGWWETMEGLCEDVTKSEPGIYLRQAHSPRIGTAPETRFPVSGGKLEDLESRAYMRYAPLPPGVYHLGCSRKESYTMICWDTFPDPEVEEFRKR